jgi:hypothetical protein
MEKSAKFLQISQSSNLMMRIDRCSVCFIFFRYTVGCMGGVAVEEFSLEY